jgi:serine/threonine protein kinase
LLTYGIVYTDLKPENLVLVRIENNENSKKFFCMYLYEIKFIDLGSLTILIDIKEFGINKHNSYPTTFTKKYHKEIFYKG